ncbi:hypothetical protein F66182_9530 [Fusarium sp. NRRL 66182]|nr:hypothetical protein F66182_9530 [Fusarium sp. NRRL 66182]
MTITTIILLTTLLASPAAAHSFPYVPTEILMPDPTCVDQSVPCTASDLAYIFRQTASGGIEFRSLNFSASVNADQVSLERPAGRVTLPFLDNKPRSTTFGAARTANGSVLVYSGDCSTGSGDVWSFNYEDGGEWYRRGLSDNSQRRRAPYFLGGTVAFSSSLAPEMDQPTLYTYGGMCARPESGDDAANWQSDANYTKTMLRLAPTNGDAHTPYSMSVASSGGPRTPIAGFTLTGLTPSMTNKSGVVTQQMSYVLLGGHTKSAFINMSTVAVWNLPAESWSYVNIQAPDDGLPTSDLAVKDTGSIASRRSTANTADNVYSRSGHTATLSEDGSSIVVLGGWVGDVDTPAEPQLAILEMSEAYSGWQWKIPSEQPDFAGLYGHGAAVLPGNMLMVYGGWETSSSSSRRKAKRQALSGNLRLYNITSGSWGSSYTNPLADSSSDSENDKAPTDDDSGSNSKRLGLGLGLGFGIAALIGLIIAALCWYKRRERHRSNRDEAVRALSQDPNYYNNVYPDMMEESDPWGLDSAPWYGGNDPYAARSLGYESMRGARGGLPGLQNPNKSLPRPSRGGYVPTGPRPGSFPGPIHPIYEDDEEDNYHHQGLYDPPVHTPTSEVHSDPFQTPVTGTGQNNIPHPVCLTPGGGNRALATPSPESPRHDPEVQDWVTEVDAAEGLLARMNSRRSQHQGAQNLDNAEGLPGRVNSRRSQNQGVQGHGQGRASPTRHNSTRSAALRDDESRSGSNLSESARSAAESIKAKARQLNPLAPAFLATGAEHPKPGSSSSSSYNTARSSFGALQAEGPSLLMGDRGPRHEDEEPGSPSKSKPRRGYGWLGSLKRVFSGASTPTSSHEDMSGVRRSFDQEPVSGDYEPGLVGLRGELLRRKQGRRDWEGVERGAMMSGGAGPEPGAESDWDIEKAVEQRLVQVMFTVPRERLRVVNGNEEGSDREDEVPMKPQAAELVDPDNESHPSRGGSLREKQAEHRYEHPGLRRVEELQKEDDDVTDEKHGLFDDREQELLDERQRLVDEGQQLDEKRAAEHGLAEEQLEQIQHREEAQKREQPPSQEQQAPVPTIQQPQTSHLQPHPIFQPPSPSPSPSPSLSPSPSPNRPPQSRRHTRGDSANSVGGFLHHADLAEPRFSHSTDRSSGILMEAQAMPLTRERPRTRVLAMVNSFESLSRENSPSPTRPS